MFVTAQGSPLTHFRRAVERESVILAETAAHEAGYLTLQDALALTALYARAGDPKFDKAAIRWLVARLRARGADDLELEDLQLAAAAMAPQAQLARARARLGSERAYRPESVTLI